MHTWYFLILFLSHAHMTSCYGIFFLIDEKVYCEQVSQFVFAAAVFMNPRWVKLLNDNSSTNLSSGEVSSLTCLSNIWKVLDAFSYAILIKLWTLTWERKWTLEGNWESVRSEQSSGEISWNRQKCTSEETLETCQGVKYGGQRRKVSKAKIMINHSVAPQSSNPPHTCEYSFLQSVI